MSVNLSKGQKVSLAKEGSSLNQLLMGLGWDVKKSKGLFGFGSREQNVDLDASAVLFDAKGRQVDQVWFRQLKTSNGSVIHTGDNRTGAGDGDDEQILVQLDKLPQEAEHCFCG
ncbi:MAG: TerD family protein [Deinococcales bacterium]